MTIIDGVFVHGSISPDRVMEACNRRGSGLDNPGFCISCGSDAEGVEPDATGYECGICGEPCVTGAEELFFQIRL